MDAIKVNGGLIEGVQEAGCVSFNYRVGLLGHFAHPELSAENEHHVSGNYAHYDQLAAQDFDAMDVPYLMGCTNDEGAGFMPMLGMRPS